MSGIYLINKPNGISSFDCIRQLKKIFPKKKFGHAGTLDPFASGLLVVMSGKATKLSQILMAADKTYEGTIYFGRSTTTYDSTGETLEERLDFKLNNSLIDQTFNKFKGNIMQSPPLYSALKKAGKRLYQYARENVVVEVEPREVTVKKLLRTSDFKNNLVAIKAEVSKGTYLRSLAYDIGKSLDIPAHLATLIRTKSGSFCLKDSYLLAEITSASKPTISLSEFAEKLPKIVVEPNLERLVVNGIELDKRRVDFQEIFSIYNQDEKLLAIYQPYKNRFKPLVIIGEADENI